MKLAIITGGAKRIGKHISTCFAEKGWNVAVIYNESIESAIDLVNFLNKKNIIVKAYKVDLRKTQQISDTFKKIFEDMGNPDVLVNNAGIFPESAELIDISDDSWNNTINVNLSSQFFCAREFSKYSNHNSRIINIASLGGIEIWKNRIPYNVSKSGVIQLTKALARELAPKTTVNCICPGAVSIPTEPSVNDSFLIPVEKIPAKRHGTTNDIFDVVYFFATTNNYLTGQVITVDGGLHLI